MENYGNSKNISDFQGVDERQGSNVWNTEDFRAVKSSTHTLHDMIIVDTCYYTFV